ncbi:hypothetical protein GCM10023176_43270 [Micromonospora coerulea]|uniref:Uncharacterized protein n=1 Tax=Micromonospora coerulea TaxID=47856 RepID=A0ABP8SUV3_9ACTN
MKTRTVAYATQAVSPAKVSSGASHQRSVRNVFAAIAARVRAPRGLVADDVIRVVSLTGPSRAADQSYRSADRRDRVHCHVLRTQATAPAYRRS